MNTLQALKPRLTSSTHTSSKVIQVGRVSALKLLGFTFSQKSGALRLWKVRTGFHDQRPLAANRHSLRDLPRTEPRGGDVTYIWRPKYSTKGQIPKTSVGRVYESQNPTYCKIA